MALEKRVKIEKIVIISIITLFVFYGIFESLKLLSGPKVSIFSPVDGSTITENSVLVEGKAKNISFISLNDRKIFIDNNGKFSEKLLLPYGYTIMKISAEDRFGKKIEKKITLWRPKENGDVYEKIKLEHSVSTSTEQTESTTTKKK